MTQDVLLTISGLHDMVFANPEENEENEPIEVITPASYYWKNGKHYILYDEVMEGIPGVVKNKMIHRMGSFMLEFIHGSWM